MLDTLEGGNMFVPLTRGLLKHLQVDTTRKWKERKRAQLRKIEQALQDLHLGCAFTPAHQQVDMMMVVVKQANKLMSQNEWGR